LRPQGRVQYFYNIKRGGGSWGTVIDGSGLKLTVAKYLSPTLRDISRQGGIAPDVECHDFNRAVDGNSAGNDECILKAVSLISS
jgi:C-terminal processing protease CtpA/Prc